MSKPTQEVPDTPMPHATDSWFSAVVLGAVGAGAGDLLVALAGARGRSGQSGVLVLYWAGIVLLYLAPAVAAIRSRHDRRALLTLVAVLVTALYIVNLLNSPLGLATTDELQTLRSLNDLGRTHHLFVQNPFVPDYARFPASQIGIVTMQKLTGLSMATSARLVIGPEELLLGCALFVLAERVCRNPLAGFTAVAIYATNPSYLYFDSQVFYESFALPLAILALLLVALAVRSQSVRERRVLLGLASVVGVVVCVSHHMTSYWLAVVLILWCVIAAVYSRRRPAVASSVLPGLPAAVTSICALLWYVFVAHVQIAEELGGPVKSGIQAIKAVLSGSVGPKKPFSSPAPIPALNDPFVLQAIGYVSVLVGLIILVAGLWQLRRRSVRSIELLLFGGTALIYPFALALRLTQASTETSNRASEFTFVGLALLAALWVTVRTTAGGSGSRDESGSDMAKESYAARWHSHLPGLRSIQSSTAVSRVRRGLNRPVVLTTAALGAFALLAVGGIVVSQSPYDRVAGTHLTGDGTRSIEPLGQEAAQWAERHWPRGTFFAADPINALLIASDGDFTSQQGRIEGYSVSHLFLSHYVDAVDRTIIQGDKISYIVVDQRLTQSPSANGPAFSDSTVSVKVAASKPVPKAAFAKFSSSHQLSRVFDDGTIRIYSTGVVPPPG